MKKLEEYWYTNTRSLGIWLVATKELMTISKKETISETDETNTLLLQAVETFTSFILSIIGEEGLEIQDEKSNHTNIK